MEETKDPQLSPSDDAIEPDASTTDGGDEGGEPQQGKKTADARINELIGQIKNLERQVAEAKTAPAPTPAKPQPELDEEAQKAAAYLKKLGFVQAEDLKKEREVLESRQALNLEHARLEGTFTGADGRPKYDRAKIEDFMRSRGIYDPEAAYTVMHKDELIEFEIKKATNQKPKPFVARPGSSGGTQGGSDTITREMIADWLKTPDGRAKYEQNRPKILKMMASGQL